MNPPVPDQLFGPKQGVPLKLCIVKYIKFSSRFLALILWHRKLIVKTIF